MTSFYERQKDLFNTLKVAEEECGYSKSKNNKQKEPQDYSVVDRNTYRRLKHEMKQFKGRESIYKRSQANMRECLRAKQKPDFIKNPQKYDYYTLSDVTEDDMSDATNTATALALMRELEEKQLDAVKSEIDTDHTGAEFKKPMFCVSANIKKEIKQEEDKVTYKNNKLIMPEYVVGSSQVKVKKEKLVTKRVKDPKVQEKNAELKLQHLYDEEED